MKYVIDKKNVKEEKLMYYNVKKINHKLTIEINPCY